jgi:hypothetical protein
MVNFSFLPGQDELFFFLTQINLDPWLDIESTCNSGFIIND